MTPAELRAFNAGVRAVLTIASRSAAVLASSTKRPLAVGFAIEGLQELAEAGAALLLTDPPATISGQKHSNAIAPGATTKS